MGSWNCSWIPRRQVTSVSGLAVCAPGQFWMVSQDQVEAGSVGAAWSRDIPMKAWVVSMEQRTFNQFWLEHQLQLFLQRNSLAVTHVLGTPQLLQCTVHKLPLKKSCKIVLLLFYGLAVFSIIHRGVQTPGCNKPPCGQQQAPTWPMGKSWNPLEARRAFFWGLERLHAPPLCVKMFTYWLEDHSLSLFWKVLTNWFEFIHLHKFKL